MSFAIKYKVLWFQISMNYIVRVKMFNCKDYFSQVMLSFLHIQVYLLFDHLGQVSSRHILKYKEMAATFGKGKWCFHKIIPTNLTENLMLFFDRLQLPLAQILPNLNNLQSIYIPHIFPPNHIHSPKGPLAQKLNNLKIPNPDLLPRLQRSQ